VVEKFGSTTVIALELVETEEILSLLHFGTFSEDESVPPPSTIDGHAVAVDCDELNRSLRAFIANNLQGK